MGKRRLLVGIAAGAVVGGLTALLDQDTRDYTKAKWTKAKETSEQIIKNPSQTVRDVRVTFDEANDKITGNIQKAIDTLEQVEQSLDKVTDNVKEIEE